MSNLRHTEVLVAGGGPAGLAAAIAARQAGFEVAVVDCAQPPIDKACGEGIMPDGLAALAALGIQVDARRRGAFSRHPFYQRPSPGRSQFSRRRWLRDSPHAAASVAGGSRRRMRSFAALGPAHYRFVAARATSGRPVLSRSRWLICADGQNSKLRKLSGLDPARPPRCRFGFRRHYRVAPWSEFVEVHWSDCGQMYVTPVADDQVCVALITSRNGLRFDAALPSFPQLAARLEQATILGSTIGATTASRTA